MSLTAALRDLNKLNAFVRVAERRSFTKAAADLRTTPSVVSKHMKDLEDALGFSLFNRSTHGIMLTDAGEGLFQNYLRMLATLGGDDAFAGTHARLFLKGQASAGKDDRLHPFPASIGITSIVTALPLVTRERTRGKLRRHGRAWPGQSTAFCQERSKDVEARDKRGHDEGRIAAPKAGK